VYSDDRVGQEGQDGQGGNFNGIATDDETKINKVVGTTSFVGHEFLTVDASQAITGTGHFKDWFFQWAFCATAATIVSGGVAERVNFPAYGLYSVVMTGIIYPFVVYWTWSGSGWLSIGSLTDDHQCEACGYSDFAGSGIVHLTGGAGALVGAIILGPRKGRFENPDDFVPHSIGQVVLGTFILWFGWYGFNCGSTLTFSDAGTATQAGLVAMNTTMSAAAGGLTVFAVRLAVSIVKSMMRGGTLKYEYDVAGMCNGILAGLVAVCAGVGDMEPALAMATGCLGGLAMEGGSMLLKLLKIDDPLDAFPVHGCAGIMGLLVRPIFDRTGVKATMLGWHVCGIVVIFAWSAGLTALVLFPFRMAGLLRVPAAEEEDGGDVDFDEGAADHHDDVHPDLGVEQEDDLEDFEPLPPFHIADPHAGIEHLGDVEMLCQLDECSPPAARVARRLGASHVFIAHRDRLQ